MHNVYNPILLLKRYMLKYSNNIKKYKTSFKFLETLGDKISIGVTFLIFKKKLW